MNRRKLRARLRRGFGSVPSPHYFSGDMEHIRAYYDYRRENEPDTFMVDDITWNDLDMDRVFKRINQDRCTSGEQYLYYMLRSPAMDEETFESRRRLIRYAVEDPERRLKAEMILARLGCTRRADLCTAFHPSRHGAGMLFVYLALFLFLIVSIVCTVLQVKYGIQAMLLSLLLNITIHETSRRRCGKDFDTVNYTVNMIFAIRRLRRLHDPELDALLAPAYESLDRFRSVLRIGGVSMPTYSGGAEDAIATITLLDLISYEFLKNKLGRCHDDVFTVHEYIGRLDAAVSIASYRASVRAYAEPQLVFDRGRDNFVEGTDLVHPMLDGAVPNDLVTDKSILITGSNASGKSTYLKTAALAVIMAQSICTVLASSYSAKAMKVYSSMALKDDLVSGESYYIVETRALKRMLDAIGEDRSVLCIADEVLRGTNTVERIAASSEVLGALAAAGALCIVATHDIELCGLLGDLYRLFHFEEQVKDDEIIFDYRIKDGEATTRNAINLLRLMGFDSGIVSRAHESAARYTETGSWR